MSQNSIKRSDIDGVLPGDFPAVSSEVVPRVRRRRFTASFKLRILREADECDQPGQIGALLRREGLYYSILRSWRRQRDLGQLAGLAPKKRGRKEDPAAKEITRLKLENERLGKKLRKAEAIIDFQKKLSELLGVDLPEVPEK